MCSQYSLETNIENLKIENVDVGALKDLLSFRILPSQLVPVIVKTKNGLKLTPMKFSLVPSWSEEPKVKFATHNARIESVTDKPTWRIPFKSQHCIVPMNGFFESVYEGPEAGHIIKFTPRDGKVLWAAGLFDYWQSKDNPKDNFFSFTILTQEPPAFILDHGHDRTPIFIKREFWEEWLNCADKDESSIRQELLSNSYHPELEVVIERPLKAGWEKRK